MNRIKNLDYFRKSEHAQPTRIGGLISILSILVRHVCRLLKAKSFLNFGSDYCLVGDGGVFGVQQSCRAQGHGSQDGHGAR